MISLIGGAPRLGKSIVATRLMEKRTMPVISTDDLYVKFTRDSGMQFAQVMHLPTEEIVQILLREAHAIEVFLQEFIGQQMKAQTDFVLEGVHLLPSLVRRFHRQYGPDVRSMFVLST